MADQRQPRMVNNKDIPLLQEVCYIKQEVISLENRAAFEKSRMKSITQHLSAAPGGGGNPSGLDTAFANLAAIEEKHRVLIGQYKRKLAKAEKIINEIESVQMRSIVTMLYLDQKPDTEVRKALGLSRWVFDNCRKTIEDAESMAMVKWHDRYRNE